MNCERCGHVWLKGWAKCKFCGKSYTELYPSDEVDSHK